MSFPFNIYLTALMAGFFISWLLLPGCRIFCRRIGLVDDPGHRKIHETTIPLAGGLSVMLGIILPLLASFVMSHTGIPGTPQTQELMQHGIDKRQSELIAIAIGALIVVVTGALDDRFELMPAVKFTGQFIAALLVAVSGARITLFVPSLLFSYAVTIFWFLTVINAFNFMDNMNGLCAGIGMIGSFFFAAISAVEGEYLVTAFALLCCGSMAGFLPHNFPKATAFLGDTGSHLTGYLMAVMATLPHFSNRNFPHRWAVLLPLLVLAVPLLDLVWVVILRTSMGKPFYVGDTNHLSHRLVRRGYSKTSAVLLIWLLSVIVGSAALSLVLFFD